MIWRDMYMMKNEHIPFIIIKTTISLVEENVVIDQARFECAPRAGFTKNSRRMCYVFSVQINSGLVHKPQRLYMYRYQVASYMQAENHSNSQ
jgi:hypothetical protein